MKRTLCLLTILLLPAISVAQAAKLKLPDFDGLAAKATESVDITLEGESLKSAGGFLGGGRGGDDPELQAVLSGLDGIFVRTFEFPRNGMYSARDIENLITEVQAQGWKKLLSIRDEEDRVEMWSLSGQSNGGYLFVSMEPDELVLVSILGNVDLNKLRTLQGRLGVPIMAPGIGGPPRPAAPAAPAASAGPATPPGAP